MATERADFAEPWLPRMRLRGWQVSEAPKVNYVELIQVGAFATNPRDRLAMGALGLGGESGEVIEAVKKHLYHGRDLDKAQLCDELGDVLWYLGLLLGETGNTVRGAAVGNIWKLHQRYPGKYPDPFSEVVVEV